MRGFAIIFLSLFYFNFYSQSYVYYSSSSENIINSETEVILNINSDGNIQAFQFDLNYDSNNFTYTGFEIFEDNLSNHTIAVSEIGGNSLRVIVYSVSNDFIEVGDFSFIKLHFSIGDYLGQYNFLFQNITSNNQNFDCNNFNINI